PTVLFGPDVVAHSLHPCRVCASLAPRLGQKSLVANVAVFMKWGTKGSFKNNFRFWRERRLARCEARGGSIPPQWGCDRRATKQLARRRPAPPGWGSLACWL